MLGANIGTLFDTLVVGLVLETRVGTAVVLLVLLLALGLTVLVLGVSDRYSQFVAAVDDRILEDRTVFAWLVVLLVLVPAGMVLLPEVT